MSTESTYVMVKPDGVQRGLVGEIIQRFERKGLQLVGLKQVIPSEEIAKKHYEVHSERPFFSRINQVHNKWPRCLYGLVR